MTSDWSSWTPMLLSAAIILPILLGIARMSMTVSNRMIALDENSAHTAASRRARMTRKQIEKHEAERQERWVSIRKYRRTSALLVLAAATLVVVYGCMAAIILLPSMPALGVMVLLVALGVMVGMRARNWVKKATPEDLTVEEAH